MAQITRLGTGGRWSDIVIHGGVARWVEVPDQLTTDSQDQIEQVLRQMDATLAQIGSDKSRLLEVLIFLADLDDMPTLNQLWDRWVEADHAPIRACVQAGLAARCRIEMIVRAAMPRDHRLI